MKKNGNSINASDRSRRFRTYFQFSMIGICFIAVFALFYACQGAGRNANKLNAEDVEIIQYQVPEDDAPVVVFETSKGTFKAVVYEDEVPKFAEYFIDLVNSGYYDGTHIFAVQDGVYFMGGSKSLDGTNTDDTDKEKLDPEITPTLWPFRGALISYGDKGGSIFNKKIMSGSRILFVDTVEFTDEFVEELDSVEGDEELVNTFKEKGGVPNFSQQYTIFGQVYEGLEVYDEICKAEVTDSESLKPADDITLDKVYMSTYGENKNDEFFSLSESSETEADSDNTDVSSES